VFRDLFEDLVPGVLQVPVEQGFFVAVQLYIKLRGCDDGEDLFEIIVG
jgi:hypothetical protein